MRLWNNIEFTNPEFLWLLLVVPLLVVYYVVLRKKSTASLTLSSTKSFGEPSILPRLKPILHVLRLAAISLLIVALARPRITSVSTKVNTNKGIDIVMAIDVSASMLARDLKPNRLGALKKVATNFVDKRPSDRIGIVIYAGESFTQTPITSDKRIVKRTINDIKWGQLEGGTAIGMGLGSAVNRLKESKAKSKVIILLTDGVNNSGFVDPKTATELAKELGIKTYTIGLGTKGNAPSPAYRDGNGKLVFQNMPVEIDEELLEYIASETEGKYFRATDNKKLEAIYDEINKLEKTEIEEFKYYNYDERYRFLVILAGLILGLEMLLRFTIFRSFI
ncbi:MAG: aerotolerance regulator BatA [Bacteroidetes bacterium MedPE-SWsnd-G1]|uniref:VWA domain-containing protein n=1 Tax=Urechidicola vernalis TaxID=3075600 RepID=A0ABU2Y7X4_9FLAO|nr:VWA domain-containing protein [Urechidicola sp. P050]MDT0553754.1 VWA domain-containing protein [Urechidicola sp. P050]OIQ40229.1 MAG: aerotolerance regulator BatA [Bacteroidetes bacterium MedPE-SWsnd-G1]